MLYFIFFYLHWESQLIRRLYHNHLYRQLAWNIIRKLLEAAAWIHCARFVRPNQEQIKWIIEGGGNHSIFLQTSDDCKIKALSSFPAKRIRYRSLQLPPDKVTSGVKPPGYHTLRTHASISVALTESPTVAQPERTQRTSIIRGEAKAISIKVRAHIYLEDSQRAWKNTR